jgi:hypothetical protein
MADVFELQVVGMFQPNGYTAGWFEIDALYDVSTLRQGETVLFKKSGTGPDQITMWSWLVATKQFVLDELERGRFTPHD